MFINHSASLAKKSSPREAWREGSPSATRMDRVPDSGGRLGKRATKLRRYDTQGSVPEQRSFAGTTPRLGARATKLRRCDTQGSVPEQRGFAGTTPKARCPSNEASQARHPRLGARATKLRRCDTQGSVPEQRGFAGATPKARCPSNEASQVRHPRLGARATKLRRYDTQGSVPEQRSFAGTTPKARCPSNGNAGIWMHAGIGRYARANLLAQSGPGGLRHRRPSRRMGGSVRLSQHPVGHLRDESLTVESAGLDARGLS